MTVPRATRSVRSGGEVVLTPATTVSADPGLADALDLLGATLRPDGRTLARVHADGDIHLAIDAAVPSEGYRLDARDGRVRITGGGSAGVSWGIQTLRQLLPPATLRAAAVPGTTWRVPEILIEDAPRFGWRGLMVDVARYFLPKHELLRTLDLMALHRLNVLHLHLSDDQGWRMEIRRYPRLTEVGAWRRESRVGDGHDGRPHGGFYSQDDLREIVAYAASRSIRVVPEIDCPGHMRALIAAYPERGVSGDRLDVWTDWGVSDQVLNVEEETVAMIEAIFDEVMEVFPGEFIGLGGDEAPKTRWRSDPRTQERMRELGVADEEELQSWFVRRIDAHLTAAGRRSLGWDEILEGGLAPGATVASWRGMLGAIAAARQGHDVVVCPTTHAYLDYRQSESTDEPTPFSIAVTVEDAYGFEPVPPELDDAAAARILGGQANAWAEHMDSPRVRDYFSYPRLAALAEALWTTEPRDPEDFALRLGEHLERLTALGVEFRPPGGPLPWQRRPGIVGRPQTREAHDAWLAEVTANIADQAR